MMIAYFIGGGVALALIIVFAFTRKTAPAVEFADAEAHWDDDTYYVPVEDAHKEEVRSTRFQPGMMYRWEPIEDLLWAYGYTHDEVRAAWKHNYINIYCNGLHAEFDGSLFATDKQGNQLYACHQFDPNADTSDSDRWHRQPTDDERRKAVWDE